MYNLGGMQGLSGLSQPYSQPYSQPLGQQFAQPSFQGGIPSYGIGGTFGGNSLGSNQPFYSDPMSMNPMTGFPSSLQTNFQPSTQNLISQPIQSQTMSFFNIE